MMQEIDVVKKGSSAWLWILIALAAVAVLLWVMMGAGATTAQTGELFDRGFEKIAGTVMTA